MTKPIEYVKIAITSFNKVTSARCARKHTRKIHMKTSFNVMSARIGFMPSVMDLTQINSQK